MEFDKNPVQFFTAVCYDWLWLLDDDRFKQIVVDGLKFRVMKEQVKVTSFVIMPNHIHLIWRVCNNHRLDDVQRDFLKFTAMKILKELRSRSNNEVLNRLKVNLTDREYQVWKRNSMSIDLNNSKFFDRKFNYVHENPCQAHWQLATNPWEYKFSSAKFYETGMDDFGILTHFDAL